jgi:hypothetical protein
MHCLSALFYLTTRSTVKLKALQTLISWIAGSNPAEGIDVLVLFIVCCVGSGLYDGLIARPEESYCLSGCV